MTINSNNPVSEFKDTINVFKDSIIRQEGFIHYSSGKELSSLMHKLHKTKLKTRTSSFDIYEFKDEAGNTIGYLKEHPVFTGKIGQITITSPRYKTEKGIGIGNTLGELLDVYKDIKIFGSEIDGITTANFNNLSFMLNTVFWGYDMDVSKMNRNIDIKEVSIRYHIP